METDDVRMVLVPVKVLAVEALMPDQTIAGKSTTMAPDTPEHALAALERMLLRGVRHDFPGASEYQSAGWKDALVPVPQDDLAA